MKRTFEVVLTIRMRARTLFAAVERAERIARALEERVSVESVEVEVEETDGRAA